MDPGQPVFLRLNSPYYAIAGVGFYTAFHLLPMDSVSLNFIMTTGRSSSRISGLTVLAPGKLNGTSKSTIDHDTGHIGATCEPSAPPGMTWRVLGILAGSRKGQCDWRWFAHAPNETAARKIARSMSSVEWSRTKCERVAVKGSAPGRKLPARTLSNTATTPKLAPRTEIMALIARVVSFLKVKNTPDFDSMSDAELADYFRKIGGNRALSQSAISYRRAQVAEANRQYERLILKPIPKGQKRFKR